MLYLHKNNIKFMWKDFFSFSKRERITIVALTALILTVQVLIWTKDAWVKFLPSDLEHRYVAKKALDAYRDSVMTAKATQSVGARTAAFDKKTESIRLVPFNPNTADSSTLRGLGLRSYVVKNIMNYRRKGGRFRKPSDLGRIYGMDSAVYRQLLPLVRMDEVSTVKQVVTGTSVSVEPTAKIVSEPLAASEPALVPALGPSAFELNTADTSVLLQLKGVGSFTANRIARYRKQLGGFYSLSQLSEIKGLYPETLNRLQATLKIDPDRIERLDVNKASLEKLRAHPYLSFYQAKVIVELRRSRGKITSMDELKTFPEFAPADLERLKWYLRF